MYHNNDIAESTQLVFTPESKVSFYTDVAIKVNIKHFHSNFTTVYLTITASLAPHRTLVIFQKQGQGSVNFALRKHVRKQQVQHAAQLIMI